MPAHELAAEKASEPPNGQMRGHTMVDGNWAVSTKRKSDDSSLDTESSIRRRTRVLKDDPIASETQSAAASTLETSSSDNGSKTKNGTSLPKPTDKASTTISGANPGDEVITTLVELAPLPVRGLRFQQLSPIEQQELERILEFEATEESWRDDWTGNLAFIDKDVRNPKERSRDKHSFRQTLLDWAQKAPENTKYIWNLIRYVLNLRRVPEAARRILSNADPSSLKSLEKAIRLTSFHPVVLQQDGWTTVKSAEADPPIGGPFLIGDRIRWEHSDAVIIAYIRDPDIGDLWKAISVDRDDLHTFDLEAEEVLDAKQKFERRQQKSQGRKSNRHAVSSEFRVDGLENGIILAASYSKGARPGVYWPARLMHASETRYTGKRSSSKHKVDVVFLSPYWNADEFARGRRIDALSESTESTFSSGPLLQVETIEASEEMIRPYIYEGDDTIDIDSLRTSFRFTGLPRAVFGRFINSHRLALALRKYAKNHLDHQITASERATAGLFECHPMTVQTPVFPNIVLNLPLSFLVAQLPRLDVEAGANSTATKEQTSSVEPIIDLYAIVESMKPPACFGLSGNGNSITPKKQTRIERIQTTPGSWLACMQKDDGKKLNEINVEDFFQDLYSLNEFFVQNSSLPTIASLQKSVCEFMDKARNVRGGGISRENDGETRSMSDASSEIAFWCILKNHGEQVISSISSDLTEPASADWRRALERLYKYLVCKRSGRDATVVLTDLRCNGHRTGTGCFERSVRLPAAVKAARLAGADPSNSKLRLTFGVHDDFIKFAEKNILPKAHTMAYIKKMKGRCASAESNESIIMLTDDSDGRGGEDTKGSKETWSAAVCAVAAALTMTKKVVHGECINGFCVSRPPGHHAGRSLHPMKAISNGFCVLNTAACAAIYATTPIGDGGLGLSRVCVIDFDVHHGNGTQDILCSTYDPRYLYISMHAGGAEVNGAPRQDDDDDPNHELHDLPSNPKSGGIYPGRCGDKSPHKGVLNIPLGEKVTPHEVGTALVQHVTPAVDKFAPDLIVLSAGFDAHRNDPMGLGTLSAKDFGHITEVCSTLAFKSCSGRMVSVLEGGYGVPCCRPQREPVSAFCLPVTAVATTATDGAGAATASTALGPGQLTKERPQPTSLLDVGADLPDWMDDQVPYALQRRLEKCQAEGFVECVKEHIAALAKSSD